MPSSIFRRFGRSVGLISLFLVSDAGAQENRPAGAGGATRGGPPVAAQKNTAKSARATLPDPAILDGSAMAPEKKNEHGMLGEFELPGDENAKSGKVGGQPPPPQGGGGGSPPPLAISVPLPGIPGMSGGGGVPSLGSGSSILSDPTKTGTGGAGQADPSLGALPNGAAQSASGGESSSPAGGDVQGGAQGSVQGGAPASGASKPQPVAIGDPSRQIKTGAPVPGVVGATTATGPVIATEKAGIGGGGKGGSGENSNRGVEKGRAMPAGL